MALLQHLLILLLMLTSHRKDDGMLDVKVCCHKDTFVFVHLFEIVWERVRSRLQDKLSYEVPKSTFLSVCYLNVCLEAYIILLTDEKAVSISPVIFFIHF